MLHSHGTHNSSKANLESPKLGTSLTKTNADKTYGDDEAVLSNVICTQKTLPSDDCQNSEYEILPRNTTMMD